MNFLYPSFLYALFGVLIPIIIHLFNLRRPKKVFFSNVDLLQEVEQQTSRKLKIKEWLILLSRILFIASLVFLFAQPFLPASNNQSQKNDIYSIYLDNSLSVNSVKYSEEYSVFQKSILELDNLINALPKNSKILFLDNSFNPKSSYFQTKEQCKDYLTELKVSNKGRSAQEIYSKQQNSLKFNNVDKANVIWISDFQKNAFNDLNNIPFDSINSYLLLPVNGSKVTNVFVDSISINSPFIQIGEQYQLSVWLRSSGDNISNDVSLKLYNNQELVSSERINIVGNTQKEISLDFVLNTKGFNQMKIVLEDNSIDFDNEFNLVLNVENEIDILEISGKSKNGLRDIFLEEKTFNINSVPSNNVDIKLISTYNAIILNEVEELSKALVLALNEFAKNGGSLVIIPNVNYLDIYNDFAIQYQKSNDTTKTKMTFPDLNNSFFDKVYEGDKKNVVLPILTNVVNFSDKEYSVLNTKTSQPYLINKSVSKGSMYAFSSPFSSKYSDILGNHGWAFPIMYQISMLSSNSNKKLYHRTSDEYLQIPYKRDESQMYKLINNNLELRVGARLSGNTLLVDNPVQEIESGFYNFTISDSIHSKIAFNSPKNESIIEFVNSEDFEKLPKNVTVLQSENEINFSDAFKEQNFGVALWKYFLLLSLIFLLTEIALIRFL